MFFLTTSRQALHSSLVTSCIPSPVMASMKDTSISHLRFHPTLLRLTKIQVSFCGKVIPSAKMSCTALGLTPPMESSTGRHRSSSLVAMVSFIRSTQKQASSFGNLTVTHKRRNGSLVGEAPETTFSRHRLSMKTRCTSASDKTQNTEKLQVISMRSTQPALVMSRTLTRSGTEAAKISIVRCQQPR